MSYSGVKLPQDGLRDESECVPPLVRVLPEHNAKFSEPFVDECHVPCT